MHLNSTDAEAPVEAMQEALVVETDEDQEHYECHNARERKPHQDGPVPGARFAEKARKRIVVASHYLLF